MTTPANQDSQHLCLSERRCVDKVDGHARETVKPSTFCPSCMKRTTTRIGQLPEQWMRLHHMIGERHAGVDVNIRRPKPGGNVPLNLHIDTLLGQILDTVTTAAEVIADCMEMDDPATPRQKEPVQAPHWANDPKQEPLEQIQRCCRIIEPNLHVLISATGIGGRDHDDPNIDIRTWLPSGTLHVATTTTGVDLIKKLDHLGSLAYFSLGMTRARTERDLPCSRCRARTVGRWAGADYFDCTSCGSRFEEDDIRRQDKVLIELHKRGLIQPQEAS